MDTVLTNGNLVALAPPGKPAHFFDHTPVNLTSLYLPPELADSTGTTTYDYNLDRQLVKTMFSDSSMIQVVYDTTGCSCGGGGKPAMIISDRGTTVFKYSPTTGNLSEIISPTLDTLRFTYDGSLPLSAEWAGVVDGRVDVSYNNDFRITSQSVNGSNTVAYGYDNDGLLTQAGDLVIAHNPSNGMVTGTTLGDVTTSYDYNTYGELSDYSAEYNGTDIFHAGYTLDDVGRIIGMTEVVLGDSNTYEYEYDLSERLSNVTRNDTLISEYFYDDNGNRITYISQGSTTTGTYDDQDRMLSYGNAIFGYNARGSLTFKAENEDTTFYNYDLSGNLISVNLPNGDFVEYQIDAQNRRVGKKINSVLHKQWIYKDQLNPVAELDGAGNLVSRFVYGSKGHVPAYMVSGGEIFRFITDHLGSVRLIVNEATGEVAQQIKYDEFGNVLSNSNPSFQPFAYAGGLYDTQTELVRFGARDYDAGAGRWTAKDPILISGGINFYVYCDDEPLNFIDPTGLLCVPIPSKKTAWKIDKSKMYYDKQIELTSINFIEGSNVGWCIWSRTAKYDMTRTVTPRKLCISNNQCDSKLRTEIKEGKPRFERKTCTEVFERRKSTAYRMFSGGDIESGDWGGCKNPWTNVMHTFGM